MNNARLFLVFGLSGHKMAAETRRNEYTSLKKNVRQANTPSLAISQRNDRMDEIQAKNQCVKRWSCPPLDLVVQKLNEEYISNKLPIKVDVSVKFVPKNSKTKNCVTDSVQQSKTDE